MTPTSVQNGPDAEGIKVTLNVAKEEIPEDATRATWDYDNAKVKFDPSDLVSVYWLGATPDWTSDATLVEKYNSIFRTDNGSSFQSESMVYLGRSIAVYPGDVTCVTADNNLKINVPTEQNANTLKNIPYVSNILDISHSVHAVHNTNVAGYHHTMYSPMKLAANNLRLNMTIKDKPEGYDLEIQKVELRSSANVFATSATLKRTSDDVHDKGSVSCGVSAGVVYPVNTINDATWSTATADATSLTTTDIKDNGDGTWTVNFAVLPTDGTISGTCEIVVYTNCGRVEFGAYSENQGGNTVLCDTINGVKARGAAQTTIVGNGTPGSQPTVDKLFEDITESKVAANGSNFQGEKIGKRLTRSIEFSMKRAILTGSEVYNSADILRYIDLYQKYGKAATASDKAMNLILSRKTAGNSFETLTKQAVDQIYTVGTSANNITLSPKSGISNVVLSTAGEVYIPKSAVSSTALTYVLGAGEWTIDQAANFTASVTAIQNDNSLTVTNKQGKTIANPFIYKLDNKGTLAFGANEVSLGEFETAKASNTIVANGQTVYLANTANLYGTVNNNGILSASGSTTHNVVNYGTINNHFEVSVVKTSAATLINAGTINDMDAMLSVTYLTDNELGTTKGVVNLKSATDEVKIYTGAKQGYIKYEVPATVTTLPESGAKYNYAIYSNQSLRYKGAVSGSTTIKYLEIKGDPTTVNTTSTWALTDLIVNGSMRLLGENSINATNIYVKTSGYILHAGGLSGTIQTSYNPMTYGSSAATYNGVVRSTSNN